MRGGEMAGRGDAGMPEQKPVRLHLDSLQALRAVAALLVMWAHMGFVCLPIADAPWLIGAAGAFGVDLFFVLSGFVMGMSHDTTPVSAPRFLWLRMSRVVPPYWLVTALMLVLAPWKLEQLWNSWCFFPIFDRQTYTNPIHWFGWTIGLELWFYGLFALAIACSSRPKLLVAAVLASGSGGAWLLGEGPVCLNYLLTPMALEFVLGLLAWQVARRLSLSGARLFVAVGVVGAAMTASALPALGIHLEILKHPDVALQRAVLWGLPAALWVCGLAAWELRKPFQLPRPWLKLGDASYSLYLVQPPVLMGIRMLGLQDWRWGAAVYLMVLPALALLSWRYIEWPLTRRLRAARLSSLVLGRRSRSLSA